MANKKDLKAFVRYDGTGRVIPGSLILQRNKPKVGNWKQTSAYECCDPSCLPPVYDVDYIIAEINVSGGIATLTILVEPSGKTAIQGELLDCDGNVLATSNVLDVPFPGVNIWETPADNFFDSCSLKFRRVCFGGSGYSSWKTANLG